jgi:hypothetical protein
MDFKTLAIFMYGLSIKRSDILGMPNNDEKETADSTTQSESEQKQVSMLPLYLYRQE